jgi:hypothetical protein
MGTDGHEVRAVQVAPGPNRSLEDVATVHGFTSLVSTTFRRKLLGG